VDEVLRGTNTIERIAASSQILKSLAGRNVICFAATHDIELTKMLESFYDNYHFQEDFNEDVVFNYRLLQGAASSRNAIKLLKGIGYDDAITKAADDCANRFLQTGDWC
jgi:DNA mismatch repair ATPase MutS